MLNVFISYAREDHERAEQLYQDLQHPDTNGCAGIDPFIDRARLELDEFRPALEKKIRNSDLILALLSRHSITSTSRIVHDEWAYCLEQGKLILPVFLEKIPPERQELEVYKKVTTGTHIDLSEDYDKNAGYLLRMLFARARRDVFCETFSSKGADQLGTDRGDWTLSGDDHAGHGSQSLHGCANPKLTDPSVGPSDSRSASISVEVGDRNHLEYWRKISLSAANISARASFRMIVDDGEEHVVEEVRQDALGEHKEGWTKITQDLSDYRRKTIALRFVVSATDQMSIVSFADVCIDDICIYSRG